MRGDLTGVKNIIVRWSLISESGCWEWQKCTQSNGYGRIRLNGRIEYVHRASYMAFKGEIGEGMDVCHTCDNRRCCNPDHLFVGSRLTNMLDAKYKGRISVGDAHAETICGEKGPGAKLKLEQVISIRRAVASGAKPIDIANIALVSVDNVRRIIRRDTWKEESKCVE